jgi:hypothetical protein
LSWQTQIKGEEVKRFRNISRTKKIVAIGATVALTLGIAGTAFAYFTSTGSGTGQGAVGTATTWGVSSVTTGGPMYPGVGVLGYSGSGAGPGVEQVTVTVKNNGSGSQEVTGFTIKIANANGSTWAPAASPYPSEAACTAADFVMGTYGFGMNPGTASFGVGYSIDLAPGASYTFINSKVSIAMVDNGAPQDNCQGVTVPLYITSP